jgi:hypothetical protein
MRGHAAVIITDMVGERRWPRFAPQAARLGILSQMGIEIFTDAGMVGG